MESTSKLCLLALILVALSSTPCRCEDTGTLVSGGQSAYGYGTADQDKPLIIGGTRRTSNRTTITPPSTETEDLPVVTSRLMEPTPEEVPAQYRISIVQTEEVTGTVSSMIICTANKPLQSCMLELPGVPIVNYTAGISFRRGAPYEYRGRGLLNGECGVRFLTLPSPSRGEFRCLGSYRDGRVDMTLKFSTERTYPFGVHLKSDGHMLSANVGLPVSIPCVSSVYHALTSCHFWVPGLRHLDLRYGEFYQSSATHEYEGAGLRVGQCGLRLMEAKKQYSGVVRCWGGVDKHRIAVDSLDLQVEGGWSDGAIAGLIVVVLIGLIIAIAVLVYGWRTRRWCFSTGNENADSDTEYDEIKNFAPKVPPYPSPQRLHLMAPSPRDSGYIEAVTIHNPEFDKHKTNMTPPIKETHSINVSRPTANQAPANVYEHMKEPQVKSVDKTKSVPEKTVDKKETDSVLQDRPGTYMFMRGVPPNPVDSKFENPKYLSLIDPESKMLRHSKKDQEEQNETLYENVEQVREKSSDLQDHPMFD